MLGDTEPPVNYPGKEVCNNDDGSLPAVSHYGRDEPAASVSVRQSLRVSSIKAVECPLSISGVESLIRPHNPLTLPS